MPIDVVSHSHPGHSDNVQVTQIPQTSGSSSGSFSGGSSAGAIASIVGTLWDVGKFIGNWILTNKANEHMAEYNSPEAQFRRFQAAGINPYMALSNVSNGNTTFQAPQIQGNPVQSGIQIYSQIAQVEQQMLQNKYVQEQIKSLNLDNEYKTMSMADRRAMLAKRLALLGLQEQFQRGALNAQEYKNNVLRLESEFQTWFNTSSPGVVWYSGQDGETHSYNFDGSPRQAITGQSLFRQFLTDDKILQDIANASTKGDLLDLQKAFLEYRNSQAKIETDWMKEHNAPFGRVNPYEDFLSGIVFDLLGFFTKFIPGVRGK